MRKYFRSIAGLCLLFTGLSLTGAISAAAQDQTAGTTPPPKVLQIVNEALKPGQGGNPHMKTESAFVQALRNANWPTHYFGMDALSGKSRAVFFTGYDSFEAWQKDMNSTMKNTSLAAAIDSAAVADGALLDSLETSVYVYREDLSLRAPVDIPHMRYMEISIYNVRPGHEHDWETLVTMYMAALEKVPNAHWATFEKMYGTTTSGARFIAISPMKSLAQVDQEMLDGKAFAAATTEEQKQKIRDLTASTTESTESHIFAINPKMSYVPDSWVKADPTFWSQK
jgi:hypothetical protein